MTLLRDILGLGRRFDEEARLERERVRNLTRLRLLLTDIAA